ncbi:MAG: hypothetical protein A2Y90_04525 [Chloroflexi bacterium RBG_13_52_12]|nr:MAG: hypothetical protein A2Y90_04525 [Chloroflexi bacterium RBG_13_52_12]
MREKVVKKRGAPKGNLNAAKPEYYSKILAKTEQLDIESASGVEGIDEEIALLRHEIKKAISGGDERNLLLLVKAASALEKLIRTRHKITAAQRKGLKEAVGNVIRDVLIPLGVNIGSAVITRKISE